MVGTWTVSGLRGDETQELAENLDSGVQRALTPGFYCPLKAS